VKFQGLQGYGKCLDNDTQEDNLSELFKAGNLKPPSLVIGKVKMQLVEFVHCERINELQQLSRAVKVACDVDHHAAMLEPRRIVDFHSFNFIDGFIRRTLR